MIRLKLFPSQFFILLCIPILLSCFELNVNAHDVIVKRNSNFREEATTASNIIKKLYPGEELLLLDTTKVEGYYHALHKEGKGWVWALNVAVIQEYVKDDWKHWIDADGDCIDTRNEALIEESEIEVTFKEDDECKVSAGRWTDPYTGEVFKDPEDLDVDHMVPLKNAH